VIDMRKVWVGSKNPVKLEAAKRAFKRVWSELDFEFEGVDAPSKIASQPMSSDETLLGAKNRAEYVRRNYASDFAVGIEGGVEKFESGYIALAWMYVLDSEGRVGKSRTSSFVLPTKIAKLLEQGYELGEADDVVFKKENTKQSTGAVGLLTKDVVTRTSYYEQALVLALIPFVNEWLYEE
jgi:inosine/xanthosine triphosphatase